MPEVARTSRTAVLMSEILENLELLESGLPRQVDGFALSQESKLPWKVVLYREALCWRIAELGRSAFESLNNDKLVSGIVLTRSAVEVTAGLWFLHEKVANVVESKTVRDIDKYLMSLSMGTATGWPEDAATGPVMPRPLKVSKFLDRVEKKIEGFNHQYGVLSEYAHPNWAGTVLLYSDTNKETAITDFGRNIRGAESAKAIGAVSLSVALRLFHSRYNQIADLLPAFIAICEAGLTERQPD